jgi:hypothetical protein
MRDSVLRQMVLAKVYMDFLMNFGQKQDIVWENYGDWKAS